MERMQRVGAALLLAVLVACNSGGVDDPGPGPGGSGQDAGPTPQNDAGPADASVPVNVGDPNNPNLDSDCDGLSDAEEFSAVYAGGAKTDPGHPDTDGDGIPDGVEAGRTTSKNATCGFVGDQDPSTTTSPVQASSDTDPCADGAEDANRNGRRDPGESDPRLPDCGSSGGADADGDGIADSVEQAAGTNPASADTDGDGLADGVEDANRNGQVNATETDPRRVDSDCDGLVDGPDVSGGAKGEDQNADGVPGATETDPRRADSDSDGLPDGRERGVTVNPDPTRCTAFRPDADPATTTDPLRGDSDNDGILDGAEDADQDGQHDPGELDPRNGGDGTGPVGQACGSDFLRPVTLRALAAQDLHLALPATFSANGSQVVEATVSASATPRGLVGYDAANKVTFVNYRRAAPTGVTNATQLEANLRAELAAVGGLSNVTTRTFTTWDGAAAVIANYDMAGTADLVTRTNALSERLVGAGAGDLAGSAGVTGPFKVQAQYVYRSAQSVLVLVAVGPASLHAAQGGTFFGVSDVAGGSALARFNDRTAVQCEPFTTGSAKVDFLFVVDDSGSMAASQQALADAASATVSALNNSTLDWRIALVTTSYQLTATSTRINGGVVRGFTRNAATFTSWLTANPACTDTANQCGGTDNTTECIGTTSGWVGVCGTGSEGALGAARKATNDLIVTPETATEAAGRVRGDATLVVVVLGDADDQSSGYTTVSGSCGGGCETVSEFEGFFLGTGVAGQETRNERAKALRVHGILCPGDSTACNDEYKADPRRIAAVVTATGGREGSIRSSTEIANTMQAIVADTIAAAGYRTLKPAIAPSVKVALQAVPAGQTCTTADVPRSRTNGFDFDGAANAVSFFGQCRPAAATQSAVSYRYWVAGQTCSADCNGTCGGLEVCDTSSCTCSCPQTATCPAGQRFDAASCGCVCDTAALNCGPTYQADPNACACVCKPDCGGCGANATCNQSTCACVPNLG